MGSFKSKIVYFLKHNVGISKIIRFAASIFLKFLGLFIKIDKDLVLFVSFMGTGFNDSPKAIYNEILNNNDKYKLKMVWAFQNPDSFLDIERVKIDTLKYFKTALKAKYWITNTNIERGLSFKRKKQVYLNTWHGVALKKIGNDCPGRNDYNFSGIDFLCVSGKHDEEVFLSAFSANKKSYLRCGMPRNDELWHSSGLRTTSQEYKKNLGIPPEKKVILYAPTWRDSFDGGKTYQIKPPINFKKWKDFLGKEYVVLFRAHHLTTTILNVDFDDFVRDCSSIPDVNKLMIASDILITDYSAIAFDYSILEKPIFCFAYDYDTYLKERGTYFDIDKLYPNKHCCDEDELLKRILNMKYSLECEKTKLFKKRFMEYGGDSTKTCVESLFLERL